MSKISIKTDFADGEKLFAQQLNNNFLVIQAGINANEENLQQVINQAIIELDRQLEEITANRGWDWNGGDRVTFFKGTTSQVNTQEIKNGQMLYNIETGETALDDNGNRIVTGSGNVVAISEEAPTNPATKEWIKPSKMANYAASYVVNSMTNNESDKSPSVDAVKKYIDGTLLWENDDPTSNFDSQTITLSSSDYDCLEVLFYDYREKKYMASTGKIPKGENISLSCSFWYDSKIYISNRELEHVNDTTYYASVGSYATNNAITAISPAPAQCVPIYIVGYKTNVFN